MKIYTFTSAIPEIQYNYYSFQNVVLIKTPFKLKYEHIHFTEFNLNMKLPNSDIYMIKSQNLMHLEPKEINFRKGIYLFIDNFDLIRIIDLIQSLEVKNIEELNFLNKSNFLYKCESDSKIYDLEDDEKKLTNIQKIINLLKEEDKKLEIEKMLKSFDSE
ncbi:hypothetical protein GVAV_000580 [Gurleya vavrai]